MSHAVLIFIDSLFKPLYFCCKWFKSIFPKKTVKSEQFYVIKFFGLGSLTRIAYVIKNSAVQKENVTFITFKHNQAIVDYLEMDAIYIRANNPFRLIQDSFSVLGRVWSQKKIRLLDMERSSNLSGIFRIFLAIRKPCASFYFEPKNKTIGNQTFVSLAEKPAITAIAELFGEQELNPPKQKPLTNLPEFTVLVNVNAGAYLPQRMFPLSQFSALIIGLHQANPNWNFVLTGSGNEKNRVHEFERLLKLEGIKNERLQNLAGQQSLSEVLTTIESSQLMITNDSGPLHCAQLVGSKTVGIWGPTSAELVGYPDSDTLLNLTPTEACHPCFLHPKSKVAKACNGTLTCFHNRDIQEMVEQINTFTETKVVKTRLT